MTYIPTSTAPSCAQNIFQQEKRKISGSQADVPGRFRRRGS